jgi:hypothetical protein
MKTIDQLDKDAVAKLAGELLLAVKAHYARRPMHRDTVLEILNAFGIATATVLAGAGDDNTDNGALVFFARALGSQLDELDRPAVTH